MPAAAPSYGEPLETIRWSHASLLYPFHPLPPGAFTAVLAVGTTVVAINTSDNRECARVQPERQSLAGV